jgi:hypothetical protein
MTGSLEDFAEKYFSPDLGKAVPLHLLRAWLSQNHNHDEDGEAFVPSMDLDRWAKDVAVTRIVDHGPYGNEKEVWSFFEEGWHKSDCETRLAQAKARIGDKTTGEVTYFEAPNFVDTREKK